MQNFNKFNDSDYISDAPDKLNDNFQTIASDYAGTSFPTTDLVEGMTCYRTDEQVLYRYNGGSWKVEYGFVDGGIEVKEANHAMQADDLPASKYATQAEAEGGVDNTKVMTPLRVKNAINYSPSVSQRNGYCRRKNLGTIASVADADAFNTAHGLSAGTFDDIFVGDEITIKDGTYNAVWLVAGIDWDYNKGDTASGHGILLIPKTPLYNDQMNETNVTTGGYKGSTMHTTKLPALVTKLQTVLGSHLKKRRVLISNSVNASLASMAGAGWTGATNGWEWTDAYAVLPSEVEVYGSTVLSSSFYDVGEACQKLPIFNFINPVYFSRWYFWLRAVASSTYFCLVFRYGAANVGDASDSYGVRPLIYLA